MKMTLNSENQINILLLHYYIFENTVTPDNYLTPEQFLMEFKISLDKGTPH